MTFYKRTFVCQQGEVKESLCGIENKFSSRICLQSRRPWFNNPWVRKIPWRREWLPTPIFLPGEIHG